MPCNSEYMNPSNKEKELSRVACLIDELNGLEWAKSQWNGYHGSVYCKMSALEKADEMVSELCLRLQSVDVSKYSLEMQIWWRDHQAADKLRVEKQVALARSVSERANALSKLTPHERKLLGIREN